MITSCLRLPPTQGGEAPPRVNLGTARLLLGCFLHYLEVDSYHGSRGRRVRGARTAVCVCVTVCVRGTGQTIKFRNPLLHALHAVVVYL